AEPIKVPAEIRLSIGEEDRLVLRAADARQREVPPADQDEGESKRHQGRQDIPRAGAATPHSRNGERVGRGRGVPVGVAAEGAPLGAGAGGGGGARGGRRLT